MRKKMLLLGALGGSWQLIPELLGFTNPEQIKLFAQRNDMAEISAGLPLIEEVWLVTTTGDVAGNSVIKLREWQQLIGSGAPTINYTRGGLSAENVVRFIREELARGFPDVTVHAGETKPAGNFSSAGIPPQIIPG